MNWWPMAIGISLVAVLVIVVIRSERTADRRSRDRRRIRGAEPKPDEQRRAD